MYMRGIGCYVCGVVVYINQRKFLTKFTPKFSKFRSFSWTPIEAILLTGNLTTGFNTRTPGFISTDHA